MTRAGLQAKTTTRGTTEETLQSFWVSVALPLSILILFRLVLQALLYRSGFLALTADDFGRVVEAAKWAERPYLVWSGVWLPFHMYLHGLVLKIFPDPLAVPRAINIFLGIVSILLMAALGSRLFGDRNLGLVSAFLLAFNPAHIWLSSTPLTEIPYFTLILGCLIAFVTFLNSGRRAALLASAGCLALANGFRFEGWMLSIPFSLYLVWMAYKQSGFGRLRWSRSWKVDPAKSGDTSLRFQSDPLKDGVSHLLLAAVLPWIFPLVWMAGNYLEQGSPFAFLASIQDYKSSRFNIPPSFLPYLTTLQRIDPLGAALSLLGLAIFLKSKRPASVGYALLVFVPAGIFLALHAGQYDPPGNLVRYLAPFLFLLIPLAAGAILAAARLLAKPAWAQAACLVLILSLFILWCMRATFRFRNDPSAAGLAVGEALRSLRAMDGELEARAALVEVSYWEFRAIQVGAHETGSIRFDRPVNPLHPSPSVLLDSPNKIYTCLDRYGIGIILVRSTDLKAAVEEKLSLLPERQVNGYTFYLVPKLLPKGAGMCTLPSGLDG